MNACGTMMRAMVAILILTGLAFTTQRTAGASRAGSDSGELTPSSGTLQSNGITIAYESFGATDREAILLIAGTGMQLVEWPIELVAELVHRGYRVVRFDNRDIGSSTTLTEAGLPDGEAIGRALEAGEPAPLPYTLQDLALDAIGVLDALGIQQAHIVGISMGGAIVQLIAIDHGDRTLSLTSLMADSGNPALPVIANPDAFADVPAPPTTADRDAFVAWQVKTWQALGGAQYPTDEATLRAQAERNFARGYDPAGLVRQQTASLVGHLESARYRLNHLDAIAAPTVVLQGTADPIVPMASAEDVAARVPKAELRIVLGLGHNIPEALVPVFADAISAAAQRASAPATDFAHTPPTLDW
jgi:pimeloyl-ACP methyl ester carboxylesterase